ncbi:MAG: RNA-binding domain-containing protein [Nitrososphaeria archaeon]
MRRPPADVRVRVEARLNPSEDPAKVLRAAMNVLGGDRAGDVVERMEGRALVVEASGARALLAVREQARRRRVMAALRRLLLENRSGTTTYVYVNRQAAYVGLISFVEEEGESPLGPIILRIESSDVDSTIDWLVPEEEALRR